MRLERLALVVGVACTGCTTSALVPDGDAAFARASDRLERTATAVTTSGAVQINEISGNLYVDQIVSQHNIFGSGGKVSLTSQGGIVVGTNKVGTSYTGLVEGGAITLTSGAGIGKRLPQPLPLADGIAELRRLRRHDIGGAIQRCAQRVGDAGERLEIGAGAAHRAGAAYELQPHPFSHPIQPPQENHSDLASRGQVRPTARGPVQPFDTHHP